MQISHFVTLHLFVESIQLENYRRNLGLRSAPVFSSRPEALGADKLRISPIYT